MTATAVADGRPWTVRHAVGPRAAATYEIYDCSLNTLQFYSPHIDHSLYTTCYKNNKTARLLTDADCKIKNTLELSCFILGNLLFSSLA